MNRRLIFKSALLNAGVVIASIVISRIFFSFFASQLFNKNVEDYLFVIAVIAALPMTFYVYRRAETKKTVHAVAVFLVTQILTGLIIGGIFLLLLLAIKIYCAFVQCRSFI